MSYKNPALLFYEDRLKTFEHWPKQLSPDKYALAQAGFYYTGEGDKVTCFACDMSVRQWERTDEPWTEHKKWSTNCVYLKMTGCKVADKGFNFNPLCSASQAVCGEPIRFGTLTTQQSKTTSNIGVGETTGSLSASGNFFLTKDLYEKRYGKPFPV